MTVTQPQRLTTEEVIEDAHWLAETGVGIYEAAHRLGRSTEALEVLLRRRGELDLLHRLRAQETAIVDPWGGRTSREQPWKDSPAGRMVLRDAEEWRRLAADRWDDSPEETARHRTAIGGAS